jgi:hypothetical protein
VCASPYAASLPAGAHSFAVRSTDAAANTTTATRSWTVVCAAPDAAGAVGLLHLDDSGQTLANAAGGAEATLGDTDQPEATDPAALAGRFGGALGFTSVEDDHVAWPAAIGAAPELSVELWVRPEVTSAARDVFVSGDGRVAVRVVADGATNVKLQASVAGTTVTSGSVVAGTWHRVLLSVQEPTLRLWVDAARTDAAGLTLGTPLALDTIRLGGGMFGGAIDEVWVSQSAITTDDASLPRYCPL